MNGGGKRAAAKGKAPRDDGSARVLYVHNSADIYGASRSLIRLVSAFREDERRQMVTPLVVVPEPGPLAVRLADLGVEVAIDRSVSIITRSVMRSPKVFRRQP